VATTALKTPAPAPAKTPPSVVRYPPRTVGTSKNAPATAFRATAPPAVRLGDGAQRSSLGSPAIKSPGAAGKDKGAATGGLRRRPPASFVPGNAGRRPSQGPSYAFRAPSGAGARTQPPPLPGGPQNRGAAPGATRATPPSRPREPQPPAARESQTSAEPYLTSPQIAAGGAAQAALLRIDRTAAEKKAAVAAAGAAKLSQSRERFLGMRTSVSSSFRGSIGGVSDLTARTRASSTAAITAGGARIEAMATSVIAGGVAVAQRVTAGIGAGVSALTAGVLGTVSGAAEGIVSFAHSIPIPNLPGLGFIRDRILGVADGMAGQLRHALEQVQIEIDNLIASAVSAVNSAIASVGKAITDFVVNVIQVFTRAIESIASTLSDFQQRATTLFTAQNAQTLLTIDGMESSATAQIEASQRSAIADIEVSRVDSKQTILEIVEFAFGHGDYPGDDGVIGFVDAAFSTSSSPQFNASLTQAFDFVVRQASGDETDILRDFNEEVSGLLTSTDQQGNSFVGDIRSRLASSVTQAASEIGTWAQGVGTSITNFIATVGQTLSTALGQIERGLGQLWTSVVNLAKNPVQALSQGASSFAGAASGFFQGLVGRLITGPAPATASLAGTPAFATSSLALAPALPAMWEGLVLLAEAIVAAIAAVDIAVVLWWAGIIILILAVIALIIYLIYMAVTSTSVPKVKAKPRVKPRVRRRPRRTRRCTKPFMWNPGFSVGKAMPGILDFCGPRAPFVPHAHHSWPMFAGGLPVQPLMAINGNLHLSILHPTLLDPFLKARFGITRSIALNAAFIASLSADRKLRNRLAAELTAFYVGFSAGSCSPGIPPTVYGSGIGASLLFHGGP
jgi:hypothetical protein